MEEKIYGVLLEILEELKKRNEKIKKRQLTDEERIELFIDYIVNFKHLGISKADLRAAKIISADKFKHFIDYYIDEIIKRTKERHNIFLSRCVSGYYLYKKPLRVDIGD